MYQMHDKCLSIKDTMLKIYLKLVWYCVVSWVFTSESYKSKFDQWVVNSNMCQLLQKGKVFRIIRQCQYWINSKVVPTQSNGIGTYCTKTKKFEHYIFR